MTRVICVTGAGGVGKTTIAAALGIQLARTGLTTLVVTVDPAKRLGQTLGLEGLQHVPTETDESGLWASMLDAQGSWLGIARRYAEPAAAARLLDNPFFKAIARRFPASQSYAAADTMASEAESGRWDAVVVDTPPSAGGVEFFTAPSALLELVNGGLIRALTGGGIPGSRTLFRITAGPVLKVADSILGTEILEDVSAFLFDLRTTSKGLGRRSKEIEAVYRRTETLVVTTSDPAPVAEARHFAAVLPSLATSPRSVIFNRAVPTAWEGAAAAATGDAPATVNLRHWGSEARRQRLLRGQLATELRLPVHPVEWRQEAPISIDALASLVDPFWIVPQASNGPRATP